MALSLFSPFIVLRNDGVSIFANESFLSNFRKSFAFNQQFIVCKIGSFYPIIGRCFLSVCHMPGTALRGSAESKSPPSWMGADSGEIADNSSPATAFHSIAALPYYYYHFRHEELGDSDDLTPPTNTPDLYENWGLAPCHRCSQQRCHSSPCAHLRAHRTVSSWHLYVPGAQQPGWCSGNV